MTLTANGHQSWGSRTRDRIDSGKIVDRLQRVAEGKEEATMVEITAARMLLDRTLPTIAAIQIPLGDGGNAKTITNDQLLNLIEGESKRIA
jgi:hypothetical protein